MTTDPVPGLSTDQQALLGTWLPGCRFVADHNWGLVDRQVVELDHEGQRYLLKVAGPSDGHLERELRAHDDWLGPWTSRGLAPSRVASDLPLRMLLTSFLPGELVLDTAAAADPDVHRQAGRLLRLLHDQDGADDAGLERRENARTLRWLDGPHRLEPAVADRVRALVTSWPEDVVTSLVPTHGDYQPRNWILHDGTVHAIDLGRADLRPAASDLLRLDAREFRDDPTLAAAFVEGYGADPRDTDPDAWRRMRLREGVGTAAWAFRVHDEPFERHGLAMVDAALADL